jgi:hypothetical protein
MDQPEDCIQWRGVLLKLRLLLRGYIFYFDLIFSADLKNNGVSLQACCIFEDEIDDFQILVPFQKTWIILLEIVQEVVEDKVGPWNTQKIYMCYDELSTYPHTDMHFSRKA